MVVLRPTAKLRPMLPTVELSAQSDTALGDWYVNRIVVRRQPLLLLLSSTSLLPVLTPARDVRTLPDRLGAIVTARLRRSGIDRQVIEAERQAMHPVIVARTVNRSVLGILADFANAISYFEGDLRTEQGLARLEDWLAETPCHAGLVSDRVVFPDRKAPELLRTVWAEKSWPPTGGADGVVH